MTIEKGQYYQDIQSIIYINNVNDDTVYICSMLFKDLDKKYSHWIASSIVKESFEYFVEHGFIKPLSKDRAEFLLLLTRRQDK